LSHGADDNGGYTLTLPDDAATQALGARLARVLHPGLNIWLSGDLGAGKTTLTRGLLRELGYAGRVKSPTYTLIELYPFSRFNLYHFDLYRFVDQNEWHDSGFREYFDRDGVCLVEWPEKGGSVLPGPDVRVRLELLEPGRDAHVQGLTEAGRRCVEHLSTS
jgi:tRNA threonylcarbamoyladenosine biosynthesis protein TsaE